ncbi:MAG TPA: efflux RND transporter periplasmic adaptor subunit, partial [Polyangia bacterium]|nr:efflux RND transporter periplasmic adaptor subunit [Polyangia bacterium]
MTGTKRRWWFLAVAAIVGAAVVLLVARERVQGQGQGDAGGKSRGGGAPGGGGAADRPVPVLTARATARDVPITLDGLGAVVAYKTVNVRTQVDGRLQKVV